MPMIDVYAATGTFASKHDLAQQLAAAVRRGDCRTRPQVAQHAPWPDGHRGGRSVAHHLR
jgi:hypothetical protein